MDARFGPLISQFVEACRAGRYRQCLELLDREYVHATPEDRDGLRAVFRSDERLDTEFGEQLESVSSLAAAAGDDVACLRTVLLSVSILHHYDSRDVLLGLNGMWDWALGRGIDPRPHFEEIAGLSGQEETHLVGGSAQAMLFGVMMTRGRSGEEPFLRR